MRKFEKKALTKVKVKNLTMIVVISFLINWTAQFFNDLTGNRVLDTAIYLAVAFLFSLMTSAGLARVALTAWRHGEAKFGEYFAYLRDPKLFLRGAALGGIAALIKIANLLVSTSSLWGKALSIVISLCSLLLYFLYFAIEMYPDLKLGLAIRRGLSEVVPNIGRIVLMELATFWWIFLVLIIALAIAMLASGLSGIALKVVLSLVMLVLTWLIGAYACLVNAGLARELFKA